MPSATRCTSPPLTNLASASSLIRQLTSIGSTSLTIAPSSQLWYVKRRVQLMFCYIKHVFSEQPLSLELEDMFFAYITSTSFSDPFIQTVNVEREQDYSASIAEHNRGMDAMDYWLDDVKVTPHCSARLFIFLRFIENNFRVH